MAVSLDIALSNLSNSVGAIRALVGATAFICGMALIFKGLTALKIFATQSFASAQKGEVGGPMVLLMIGGILMYLPSASDVTMFTLFNKSQPGTESELVAYLMPGAQENWANISLVLVKYMMLVGFIAFVRGWLILSKMGASGSQPGSLGKGLTHIVGGMLLMNIPDFMNIMGTTFGFTGG